MEGVFRWPMRTRLDDLPGVVSIAPLVFRATTVRFAGNSWRTLVAGLGDEIGCLVAVEADRRPTAAHAGEALVESGQAASLRLEPEQSVTVLARRGTASLTVVGTVSAASLRELDEGASLVVSLETAHRVFGIPGQVDRIRVQTDTAVRRDELQAELSRRLPAHLSTQAPVGRMRLADELLRSTELALAVCGRPWRWRWLGLSFSIRCG